MRLNEIRGSPKWHKKDLLTIRSFTSKELKCMIKELRFLRDAQVILSDALLEKIKSYRDKRTKQLELPEEIYHFFDVEEPYETLV